MNENPDKHICERVFRNVIGEECAYCKKKFVQFDIVVTRWGKIIHEKCDKPAELARIEIINKEHEKLFGEQTHL